MTAITMQEQKAVSSVPNVSSQKERKIYTGTAAKLLNYLANGCTQVEAARACGVDESLVSQFMAEEDFKTQVREKLEQNFKEASKIDDNYQKLETVATERLVKIMEHEYSPDRLLRVAKFANEAKRKLAPNTQNGNGVPGTNGNGPQGVAVLILPNFIVAGAQRKEITLNPNNEIVAVDGKELTTFNSQGMDKLVESQKQKQITQQKTKTSLPKMNGKGAVDPYADL